MFYGHTWSIFTSQLGKFLSPRLVVLFTSEIYLPICHSCLMVLFQTSRPIGFWILGIAGCTGLLTAYPSAQAFPSCFLGHTNQLLKAAFATRESVSSHTGTTHQLVLAIIYRHIPRIVHQEDKVLAKLRKEGCPSFQRAVAEHILFGHNTWCGRSVITDHIALNVPSGEIIRHITGFLGHQRLMGFCFQRKGSHKKGKG